MQKKIIATLLSYLLVPIIVFGQIQSAKVDPLLTSIYNGRISSSLLRKTVSSSLQDMYVTDPNVSNSTLSNCFGINVNDNDPIISVIINYEGDVQNIKNIGVTVYSNIGNMITARLPLSKLPALESLTEVKGVSLARLMESELDVSDAKVSGSHGRKVSGLTGKNVIVAVIDNGIDINHDDFKNPDGTTRILYIWDQSVTSPSQTPKAISGHAFDYGTEWNASQINNRSCTIGQNLSGYGHGTHVTGIAAGNGRATGNNIPANKYVGMAPEADIIIVKSTLSASNVIDALTWIGEIFPKEYTKS
ncbi:MAG TPA: S8 family serine peptidase [Ignavibacteriales bacterium]|nr:S8 family serine peptidase [Ignavibacteriales bacterium]